jgi:hypothetical protein
MMIMMMMGEWPNDQNAESKSNTRFPETLPVFVERPDRSKQEMRKMMIR